MNQTRIISARRSAVVPRGSAFAGLSLHDLATPVLQACLSDAGIAQQDVQELIVSNALGAGGNPARLIALNSGLPETVAGLSIDCQCAGGLDALRLGDAMIRSGQCDVVIAGGVESYSRRPLRYHTFADGRPAQSYDQAPFTPWPERDPDMAQAAHNLAKLRGIPQDIQDLWAIMSHEKACKAPKDHIVPLENVTQDPFSRHLTQRHCARAQHIAPGITAANMAVAADGAAFAVLVSDNFARSRGLRGKRLIGALTLGGDPQLPGLAPIQAIRRLMETCDITQDQITHFEVMEAFAVQAIACQRAVKIPLDRINIWGGALARGHPVGASGAILVAQLFHQLNTTEQGVGLCAIAAAGGLGSALLMAP